MSYHLCELFIYAFLNQNSIGSDTRLRRMPYSTSIVNKSIAKEHNRRAIPTLTPITDYIIVQCDQSNKKQRLNILTCPALRNLDNIKAETATSKSASSNTINEALPPNSRDIYINIMQHYRVTGHKLVCFVLLQQSSMILLVLYPFHRGSTFPHQPFSYGR